MEWNISFFFLCNLWLQYSYKNSYYTCSYIIYLMIKHCNWIDSFVEACLFATALMSKWEIDWKYLYSIMYWMCFQNHIVILSLLYRALLFSCEWFPIKRTMLKLCHFLFLNYLVFKLISLRHKIIVKVRIFFSLCLFAKKINT